MANPKTQGMAAEEEDEDLHRIGADEPNDQNKTTPVKASKKASQKKAAPGDALSDEKNVSVGKSTSKILKGKLSAKDEEKIKHDKPRTKSQEKRDALKRLNRQLPIGFNQHNKASYIYLKLENMKLFDDTEQTSSSIAQRWLQHEVEETYRTIYMSVTATNEKGESIEKGEHRGSLKNMKMQKRAVIAYLRKRYTNRLAQKIATMFDWSNG